MFRSDIRVYLDPFSEQKSSGVAESGDAVPNRERDDADLSRLQHALSVDRIYRDGSLSIANLATRLKVPEYRLRRLIHERMGYRNFNALLHDHRIADACTALADPNQRNVPVLTIALSLGYNSINPFNRAFREAKGMTPSEFRTKSLSAVNGVFNS
jgi:AraC-like DNA-binding protein